MKKYISFSVLLCICIGIVGVLLWQFRGFMDGSSDPTDPVNTDDVAAIATGDTTPVPAPPPADTTPQTPPADVPDREPDAFVLDLAGTMLSRHVTDLSLRVEWAVYRSDKEADVYLNAEIYLDGSDLTLPVGRSGYVTVAGETVAFSAPSVTFTEAGSIRLTTVSFRLSDTVRRDVDVPVLVSFDVSALHGSVHYQALELEGFIRVTDRYSTLADRAALSVPSSDPSLLPSGTAVLSLASLLNHYGLEADPVAISDVYLDKMPAGFATPEEANVGNPKNEFNSYECHAPVIAACADRYLTARGSALRATDLSGCNLLAMLLELSEEHPLIVWMPADTQAGPTLVHSWTVENETVYMNEIRCAVLCGYDRSEGTVTLVYPGEEPTVMDLSLFEEMFLRMGGQCVSIR